MPSSSEAYRNRLDELFGKVDSIGDDEEMLSHWAKYLCVLVSGYIEVSLRAIYSQYIEQQASVTVARYATKQVGQFQNPKMYKIMNLAKSFDTSWEETLDEAITQNPQLKASINSIVSQRHNIAHGQPSNITIRSIRQYYEDAKEVIEIIDGQCRLDLNS